MLIVGYGDRLSVAPGETVRFMVSTEQPNYHAQVVRLIHGDANPEGPGFKEEAVATPIDGDYPGRAQSYPHGSYALVPDAPALRAVQGFTLAAWIQSTLRTADVQSLLGTWSEANGSASGFGLLIDADGKLTLRIATAGGQTRLVTAPVALRQGEWYFVAASYDAASGRAILFQQPVRSWPIDATNLVHEETGPSGPPTSVGSPFLMAAHTTGASGARLTTGGHFNGKLEAPRLFSAALDTDALRALASAIPGSDMGHPLLGTWDFALDTNTARVADVSGSELHGQLHQTPARAMTGHNWRGEDTNFENTTDEYGAIHFHEDDLTDAGWDVDFSLAVPETLRSGVYAVKLTAGEGKDYVPFFVRPAGRKATADVLFLVPTNSYLAYGNEHVLASPEVQLLASPTLRYPVQEQDQYVIDNRLLSLYDHHTDGSGVCYSSRLRPIVNMRPGWDFTLLGNGVGYPHQFNADLHLVDWLTHLGIAFDVATDEDLHAEGHGLLSQYRVVLTGSHAEYWSGAMLDALDQYLQGGGRAMYMAGNGLYWVTSFGSAEPHVVEVRRWGGTQSWTADPGQYYHSTTGELGGLWRERGRAPQRYVGVGFTAQGFDRSLPYHRQPGSNDPRAAFIFEGIGDEPIGDSGLVMGGAAGFEVDRADAALGTPAHALIVATATGFSDSYQHVIEEVGLANSLQGGTVEPRVKADMVFYETPNGGAVFSVGSIAYCGSLSPNNYQNRASRLTENVLRRFMDPAPLA